MRSATTNRTCFPAVLLSALGGLVLSACFATAEEKVEQTLEVGPSTRIRVRTLNGRIRITRGSAGQVRLTAIKKTRAFSSPRRLLKDITIKVERTPDSLAIAAEHPASSLSRMYGTEFHLAVPAASTLDLGTKNGSIRLSEIGGEVEAETKNGSITVVDATGKVRLSTMNGSIKARGFITELAAHTRNGSVSVNVQQAPSAPAPAPPKARPATLAPPPSAAAPPSPRAAAPSQPAGRTAAKDDEAGKADWKSFDKRDDAKTEKPKEVEPARVARAAEPAVRPAAAARTAAAPRTPRTLHPKGGAKVVLTSKNGSIRLTGAVRSFIVETRNGSVKVLLDRGSVLESASRAETRNGSVTFEVFEGFACTLSARTSLGSVRSDFPLERREKKQATGTIGRGGPRVTLRTSNGSIKIRQR